MEPKTDPAPLASDLRVVLGQLVRRLRAEHRFPLSQGTVLGRLDREGSQGVSDLALAERVRPQSMAQTVGDLEQAGFVTRRPDPRDGRRALVSLTEAGRAELEADRRHREGWLVAAIEGLSDEEQAALGRATELLRRLAEA
ncbi:MAG TPA: MarR family transcriptional regulator [Solirubrobacterales bacterium]|jgi:DNA-binding MarR family transcriptional regulator|nr:MarR family transcriptional regulator [Solirubrobacterales bacterium]